MSRYYVDETARYAHTCICGQHRCITRPGRIVAGSPTDLEMAIPTHFEQASKYYIKFATYRIPHTIPRSP